MLNGVHPGQSFQLLELSSNIWGSLGYKSSTDRMLVGCSLWVEGSVNSLGLTESFVEISGGLIGLLDY